MLDKLKKLFTADNDIPAISAQDAHNKLSQKGVILIDVRETDEYKSGHAKGAKHIPLGSIATRWQELHNYQEIIVICRSGNRSMMACRQLAQLGIKNVSNLSGGTVAWVNANLPTQ